MYRMRCAEIWGGNGSQDQDLCSAGIVASLYSNAVGAAQGGDIYYLSVCESDKLTRIAIADVVGHGAEVAAVSQRLYNILEARMNDSACDEVLMKLNESASELGIKALTTAAVVGFYTDDSKLYFAYAGHTPVLLQRLDATEWETVEIDADTTTNANAPLGVIPAARFDQRQLSLQAGDRIFLYTDGLTEATNAKREPFGLERLKHALRGAGRAPLADVKYAVLEAASAHIGSAPKQDDVTLIALEILPQQTEQMRLG